MGWLLDFYWQSMKTSMLVQFQYRIASYFFIIGMIAEPLIYLVVWSTVANEQGGSVGGYTAGSFAAYYIVWTLVRNINLVFSAPGWEYRIRRGELSAMLLRPLHPIHYDLASYAGGKIIMVLLWLPIAVLLSLVFHPTFDLTPLGVAVFFVAIWCAFIIRSLLVSALGMIAFWTTRGQALFELYIAIELVLSGRLAPLSLLPAWLQGVSGFLPFQWSFSFPIEALIGQLNTRQLLAGLGMQALWIGVGALLVRLIWRLGVRHFASVGN